ncbi:hypothetical protein MMC13_006020 [Lambiella insularis]|nr:hypothetical protein [Lambiella insularis]
MDYQAPGGRGCYNCEYSLVLKTTGEKAHAAATARIKLVTAPNAELQLVTTAVAKAMVLVVQADLVAVAVAEDTQVVAVKNVTSAARSAISLATVLKVVPEVTAVEEEGTRAEVAMGGVMVEAVEEVVKLVTPVAVMDTCREIAPRVKSATTAAKSVTSVAIARQKHPLSVFATSASNLDTSKLHALTRRPIQILSAVSTTASTMVIEMDWFSCLAQHPCITHPLADARKSTQHLVRIFTSFCMIFGCFEKFT